MYYLITITKLNNQTIFKYDYQQIVIVCLKTTSVTFTGTMASALKTDTLQRLVVALMPFSQLRPALSSTMAQRYPYWLYHLTSINITQLEYRLQALMNVWPIRHFENYTKLKVMMVIKLFLFKSCWYIIIIVYNASCFEMKLKNKIERLASQFIAKSSIVSRFGYWIM